MLKQDILFELEKDKGELVTGGVLAERLGVTRAAVWKAIRSLIDEGNLITAYPNSGYMLHPESDGLNEKSIAAKLNTRFIGRELLLQRTVASTNQYLREMELTSASDGLTIIADEQTQGKGRHGRAFFSPARQGVYMSILLKPGFSPTKTRFLTICAAVAVTRALEIVAGIAPKIKWVNDICHNGKKLCGILTEATISAEAQTIDSAIIGIGVNTGNIPDAISDIAVSLPNINGKRGIRNALIAEILNQMEAVYEQYRTSGDTAPALAAYSQRLQNLNEIVCVRDGDRTLQGIVKGVDDTGALLLLNGAETIRIFTGEIITCNLL